MRDVAFASPADGAPDVDEVTYWHGFQHGDDDGSAAHAQQVRTVAAAYADGALGREWRKHRRRGRARRARELVTTQGHVLRTKDFVSTLVFEAAVHHLDMTDLPPDPGALSVVRRVLAPSTGTTGPTR